MVTSYTATPRALLLQSPRRLDQELEGRVGTTAPDLADDQRC